MTHRLRARLQGEVQRAEAGLAALAPLGFVRLDAGEHALLMNDFGPGSIDGRLGDVVGRGYRLGSLD